MIDLGSAKLMATVALMKLSKSPDKFGNYPYMQISLSEHNRVYIYMCPVVKNSLIIREERARAHRFSRVLSVTHKQAEEYIFSMDSIVYIAITERSTNLDTMTVLYEKEDNA